MNSYLKFDPNREGIIGNGKYPAEVLFILREPHEENNRGYFWFRNDVYDKEKFHNRYYKVLSLLADLLILGNETSHEKLGKCAYLNIYPMSGEATASKTYQELLADEESVKYRIKSCLDNLKPKCIITCSDIFRKLTTLYQIDKEAEKYLRYHTHKIHREFDSAMILFENEVIPIYEFYHPKARRAINSETITLAGKSAE